MKICEAFRKKWEVMFEDHGYHENIWMLYDVLATVEIRQKKYKDKSLDWTFFVAWNESIAYYLTVSDLRKCGLTEQQMQKAVDDGFISFKEYFNADTRAGRYASKQWRLTAKGKRALFNAYKVWQFERPKEG